MFNVETSVKIVQRYFQLIKFVTSDKQCHDSSHDIDRGLQNIEKQCHDIKAMSRHQFKVVKMNLTDQ